MKVRRLNERVALAEFSAEISMETLQQVTALKQYLETHPLTDQIEVWSTYHHVAMAFDPEKITFQAIKGLLEQLPAIEEHNQSPSNKIQIPVQYHQDTEDIKTLSNSLRLSPIEIAKLHQSPSYSVAMLGFQPGFPFLIGLPDQLHHPRKKTPRLRVPGGAVAIGGAQTGIYPAESPGGWYVIGQTEVELFTRPDHFLLKPGDLVEFIEA